MNLDRDLRDALGPLAGDPASDAARVMAALPLPAVPPATSGQPRGEPVAKGLPAPWAAMAVVATLAVGAALGAWWSRSAAGAGPEQPAEKPAEQPAEKPAEKPPDPMSERGDTLMLMAFGELVVDEPGVGRQRLEGGGYALKVGTTVRTEKALAGIYAYANDARVRIDVESVVQVDAETIDLQAGRVWLSTVTRPAPYVVRAGGTTIASEAVEVQIAYRGADLEIVCLDGEAKLGSAAGPLRSIAASDRVRVGVDGTIVTADRIGFAATETAWMVPLIRQQQDERELVQRIDDMVAAFAAGPNRDPASLELRRIGARSLPRLYLAMFEQWRPTDEQRQAAALMADLAEFSQVPWLFALLENVDADVRATGFRALVRVGAPIVDDEEFWRSAPAIERERSLARWRARMR